MTPGFGDPVQARGRPTPPTPAQAAPRLIHPLLALLLLLTPAMAGACGNGEKMASGYENASIRHTHDHWRQGDYAPIPFVIIDVRTPQEYAEGHIPGARLLPVQQLADRIAEIPRDKQVYLYCHSGVRSARAATMLAKQGFTNIENVTGGIVAWKKAGFPVTPPTMGAR